MHQFCLTRWRRTPAHCDASRISAGVQFISSAAARPNHAKHIQNLSIPCSKGSKSFQIPPQTLPKPSQNLSKATQNPSKRPLGAHLGPMLLQDMILKVQKSVKMRPKVTTRLPRASQTLPKLSATPSKFRFLGAFLRIFFDRKFTSILYQFFRDFYMFF